MIALFVVIDYWGGIIMKQIRIIAILAVLCMILPLATYAQDHRHARSAELNIVNNTATQVTVSITTERYGKLDWPYAPGEVARPASKDSVILRVRGDDRIQIADWGTAYIRDVAVFSDGVWNLNIRQARRVMHGR